MTVVPTEPRRRYTIAEYVRLEERGEIRHEYHDGEILAMSGGSYAHALIATNINRAIGNRLNGKPCRVLDANMRIATPHRMFYPDGSIVCGPPQFDPRDPSGQSLTNARVIIEVLSPSTENYDRKEKFDHYGTAKSIEEYVTVYQDETRVECFVRAPGGSWNMTPFIGLGATALIRCVQIEVPLTEIYADVVLPPPAPPPLETQPLERNKP
jgi:Uma2 family endonuclease